MSDQNSKLRGTGAGIDSIIPSNDVNSNIVFFTTEECKDAVMAKEQIEEPCVCGACIMCNNATTDSIPVHILKDGEKVELGGLAELNKKDILLDMSFAGCKTAEDKICGVKAEDIEDGEWKDVDKTKNQGEDKETLKSQSSYMVCTKEWGILYFVDNGQQAKSFADELSTFLDYLQEQFGFDRRTVGVLGEIYRKIQEQYADCPSKERDWYFARSISQMAGYDEKLALGKETDAWVKGAGKAYEHGIENEKMFFCEELGIDEADYKYMRQMVRLQHAITSNYEGRYTYSSVYAMRDNNWRDFQSWKKTMEEAIGEELGDDEYLKCYEQIYSAMSQKGDFSHMLYTISANLIDEGHGVENQWNNVLAPETSWDNAEERKDIVGWLGDAVYDGPITDLFGKVSFGTDDYIADLDADNIAYMVTEGKTLVDAANEYYANLQENGEGYRAEIFVKNNTYEKIESSILEEISAEDRNKDKKVDYRDLEESDKYQGTYEFLKKLEPYSKVQKDIIGNNDKNLGRQGNKVYEK